MDTRYSTKKPSVFSLEYHFVWCTKYRRDVLKDEMVVRLKELLFEKAEEQGWEIKELEIKPDHVHIFIAATGNDAPNYIVSQLKAYSHSILKKELPKYRSRIATLWTRSYYVQSVGRVSKSLVRKYIEEQKNV